jgi:Raf kinase inhibitor-like YbhB/YbcL family protein
MRRRRNVIVGVLALTTGAALVSACDTDDGRDMQEPQPYQVFQLENTDPTTTSTTSTIAPATTTSSSTTSTSTSTSSSSSSSLPTASTSPDGGANLAAGGGSTTTTAASGSVDTTSSTVDPALPADTFAAARGLPDLAATGVEFTGPWSSGSAIDVEFTCDGDDQPPLLTWTAPPEGTVEMALVVTDESSDPVGFVHWIVVGLPPEAGSVGGPEPIVVAAEAMNSFGNPGWQGPCPPDPEPHSYRFALYALSQAIELPPESLPSDMLAAVEAAASGVTSLTGTYQRA